MRAARPRSLPRPRPAPLAVGKSGHQQPSGNPQVRNDVELVRLLAGDLVSAYAETVKISMLGVPSGLTPCQRRRVRDFLRDVLRPHEDDHARRFRTYNGRTVIPLDLTGCGSAELHAQVAAIHDAEAAQRQADADALSAEIDPFTRGVDLNCE